MCYLIITSYKGFLFKRIGVGGRDGGKGYEDKVIREGGGIEGEEERGQGRVGARIPDPHLTRLPLR